MRPWTRLLLLLAGLFGASGVALSAVAAHMVGDLELVTASQFLLFHAAALVAAAALAVQLGRGRPVVLAGGTIIAVGTLLFSGDLTMRALMGVKLLGGSAPFGGTLMILGWLALVVAGVVARGR